MTPPPSHAAPFFSIGEEGGLAARHPSRESEPVRYIRHGSLAMPASAEPDYLKARAYASRDAQERHLFARLEHARTRTFKLRIDRCDDDHFDPNTDTIAWDPRSALRTTRGGRQSPALGLAHEIDHAVEGPRAYDRLSDRIDLRYDSAEERRVIRGSERHAARTLHENSRNDHAGTCYRVSSPAAR